SYGPGSTPRTIVGALDQTLPVRCGMLPPPPAIGAAVAQPTERRESHMAERAAIVTGASSGIGLAIARVLGEEGFGITMAARRPEKLDGAVAELAGDGFDVHGVAANVADEAEIQRVVGAHRDRYGRLDVLVNNA